MAKVCLKAVLDKKGLTKYRFAKLIGEPYSNTVRFYKSGYDPRLTTLAKWAKALKISIKDLVDD